jgi:hypothetical protein
MVSCLSTNVEMNIKRTCFPWIIGYLGAKRHFWYLSVGIDHIEDEDSRGTMLLGMSSILKMFPHMISGFELHPLDPASTLPFLTSNDVKQGFPHSALLMFKYFHVKNKINS